MSGKYTAARQQLGEAKLSWPGDKIVAQLVSRDFMFNPNHRDERALVGVVGKPAELTGKTLENGWAKSASIAFRQVSGAPVVGMVLRRDSTDDTTLIVYLDDIAGFPMKPNGGDIVVSIPSPGLFRI